MPASQGGASLLRHSAILTDDVTMRDGTGALVSAGDNGATSAPQSSSSQLTDVIGAVSNFSVQYNFAVIGVTLLFMQQAVERETLRNGTVVEHRPFIPDEGQTSALASAVFAGAIFGQLSMGYLGDAIGRPAAMLVCQTLTVAGSLGSAVLSHGESLFMIITVCRFFLGIGVGGQYPLSAVMATEGASPTQHKSTAAARAFFWQMPGALSPYVVALLVYVMSGCRTRACNDTATVSIQFRLLLGLGAFPASLGFLFTWIRLRSIAAAATARTHSEVSDMPAGESAEEEAMNSGPASSQGLAGSSKAKVDLTVFGMCRSVAEHKELWPALIGTGASWFMYDVVYYGTVVFQPEIVQLIFGSEDGLEKICQQNILVSAVGIPSVLTATCCLRPMGTKNLQNAGFLFMAVMCFALALLFLSDDPDQGVLFAVFVMLVFSLNWGVNLTTFILPAETFPEAQRATFNGISAALGKLGALVGAACFLPISVAFGISGTFFICSVLSLIGIAVTQAFVVTAADDQSEPADDTSLSFLSQNEDRQGE